MISIKTGSAAVAACALGLLAVSQAAAAQVTFSADSAVATDNTGEAGSMPHVSNEAAEELGGGDATLLERQDLVPVTSLPRTCDCFPAATVVRTALTLFMKSDHCHRPLFISAPVHARCLPE